jgi:hypothetical protein
MLEDFALLDGVTTIGYGEAEMIRDQIQAYVGSPNATICLCS